MSRDGSGSHALRELELWDLANIGGHQKNDDDDDDMTMTETMKMTMTMKKTAIPAAMTRETNISGNLQTGNPPAILWRLECLSLFG